MSERGFRYKNISQTVKLRNSEINKEMNTREKERPFGRQREEELHVVYQYVRHVVRAGSRLVCESSAMLAGRTHACHPPFCLGPLLYKYTHIHSHTHAYAQGNARIYVQVQCKFITKLYTVIHEYV